MQSISPDTRRTGHILLEMRAKSPRLSEKPPETKSKVPRFAALSSSEFDAMAESELSGGTTYRRHGEHGVAFELDMREIMHE